MLNRGAEFLPLTTSHSGTAKSAAATSPSGPQHPDDKSVNGTVTLHVTVEEVLDELEASGKFDVEQEIPCSPLQEEVLRRASAPCRPSIIRLDLSANIVRTYERVWDTWHALARHHHVLRATFAQREIDGQDRFYQKILKQPSRVAFGSASEIQLSYSLHDPARLVVDGGGDSPTIYLCLHPALADQTSLGCLWKDFLLLLGGGRLEPCVSFSEYWKIQHTRDVEAGRSFWDNTLRDADQLTLHSMPLERYNTFRVTQSTTSVTPRASSLRKLSTNLGLPDISAAVYTAMWLTLSHHSQETSGNVVFAVEGRDRTLDGYRSVVGFADLEYPLRLQLDHRLSALTAIPETDRLNSLASGNSFIGYDAIRASYVAANCYVKVVIVEGEPLKTVESKFPITITVHIRQHVSIIAHHDTAIPETKVRVLLDHFTTVLARIVDHPWAPLNELEIISPEERQFILEVGKPLAQPVSDNVHKMFERQVAKTPHAPVAQFEADAPLTYDQLNSAANHVARKLPVTRGSFVPVCLEKSVNLVIALVAILKAGAAYVTLDPEIPHERNKFIVEDVQADVVIVDRKTAGRFSNEMSMENLIDDPRSVHEMNLDRYCEPDDPVYVIYTSGSTGKPKGVLHRHSSATSGLDAFPTLPNLRQLLFHNVVFSAAQRSVWSTLKQGGCLCLASKDNLSVHIGRTINQMQINVIDVTPSTALLITPGTVPCLKRMTVAGELINPALIPMWVKEVELLNAYGLSENTQVNWRREMVLGQNPQNIGRPSDTTTAYVLIPGTTKLSPLLVPGELCLGGHQLAVRYLNRPEKTAEVFIDNLFGPGRLYRTGDMVIAHEDGSVEMVGRIDFQVKINGQRVEPGDSNTIIQSHSQVYTSGVVAADIGGRKALVGVVVPRKGAIGWTQLRSEIKELLQQQIPGYMIPTYWLLEAELPLNINGKVDIPQLTKYVENLGRDHLLQSFADHNNERPDVNGHEDSASMEELSPPQLQLRDLWASILSLSTARISPHDYFQSLGGTSLDAIRVASKANELGLVITAPDLLRLQLREITPLMKEVKTNDIASGPAPFSLLPNDSRLDRKSLEDAFPTTAVQEGFLSDSLMGNSTYIYRRYYRIKNKQAIDFFAVLQELAHRHPVLRTTFVPFKTGFLQVIRKTANVSWKILDMTAEDFSASPKQLMELGGNFVLFTVLRADVLAVTVHHALLDYWSNSFLMDDIVAAGLGQAPVLRPSYANFIQHSQSLDHGEMKAFWQKKLQSAEPTMLDGRGADNITVSAIIGDHIEGLARVSKVSLGFLMYAAWAVVISLHTAMDEVVFGVTLSGRDVPVNGITRISGPTVTTIPVRIHVNPEDTLIQLAQTIRNEILELSSRSQLGLRNILRAANLRKAPFDTIVNVLIREDASRSTALADTLDACPPYEPNYLEQTMLEVESLSRGNEVRLLSSFPSSKARFVLGNVTEILQSASQSPSLAIADMNAVSTPEAAFLETLSSKRPTSENMLAHSRVEQMADLNPDKIALQDLAGTKLTYREFHTAVCNFAQHLNVNGIHHGDIVPVCMKKSINTLIAVFGVLRSGAAYTPLDPRNPRDRNLFIIRDTDAQFAITDNDSMNVFEGLTTRLINMDQLEAVFHRRSMEEVSSMDLSPQSLAYVIYTSGSTGLPKGVQVSHASVAASTEGMIEACNVNHEWNVLWFLNYVFDASYFDVFTVLGSGGTISIADQDTMINDLTKCVNYFGARQLMITPTIAKLLSPNDVPTLQALLVCGEPITPEVALTWATRMDVYNGYGPTEATILMTVSKVTPSGNLKSVGYPLKAVRASILHPRRLQYVPWGTVGELCVSGAHVAQGYLNRLDLTASAFLTLNDGSVIYRTGDFARWCPNGEIECLGRKDSQIKLNGFRIELGEIENAILSNVGDLVYSCVAKLAQIHRKKQIVVFYVPVDRPDLQTGGEQRLLYTKAVLDPAKLLERLKRLPHYMMPKLFLPLSEFPLLPSGKVDRKKLQGLAETLNPADLARYDSTADVKLAETTSSLSHTERILRDAWSELFGVPPDSIRLSDVFFHYGGDSIAAINLVSILRTINYTISVNDILAFPALKDQATVMARLELSSVQAVDFVVADSVHDALRVAGLEPTEIEDIYPCAPGQIEFLTQGHTKDQFWQLMTVRRLPRGFDLPKWRELTTRLTAENQILRAMYIHQNESEPTSWVQVVLKEPILDLTIQECSGDDDKTSLIEGHWNKHFALGKPFVRYLILQNPDGTMDLCIKLDHAMYDGTLLRIFDDQFTALRDGQPLPKVTPFKTFIEHTHQNDRGRTLSFWKSQLQGSSFSYPSHIQNPRVREVIVANFPDPLDTFSRSSGVTPSIVFQTAYTILLSFLGTSTDIIYDYLLTGRNVSMENPQLINGTCANFLPFRSRVDPALPITSFLKETQSMFWQITENGLVSLADIYRALCVDRATHAAKNLFLFQPFEPAPAGDGEHKQEHMRWIVMAMSKVTMFVNYAIMFEVFKDIKGHKLKMQYDERLLKREDALKAMGLYQDIVRRIITSSQGSLVGDVLASEYATQIS